MAKAKKTGRKAERKAERKPERKPERKTKRKAERKAEPKAARNAKGPAPAGPRIEVDHLFLGTSDFGQSWEFWTQTVGMEGLSSWGDPKYAGSVKLGGGAITVAEGEERRNEELGYEVRHGQPQLFLRTDNLTALHRRMKSRGAKILAGPKETHWGARCFSTEGPDGMVVVFVEGK